MNAESSPAAPGNNGNPSGVPIDQILQASPVIAGLVDRLANVEAHSGQVAEGLSRLAQQLEEAIKALQENQRQTMEAAAAQPASPLGQLLVQLMSAATAPRPSEDTGTMKAVQALGNVLGILNDIQKNAMTSTLSMVSAFQKAMRGIGPAAVVEPAAEPLHAHLAE